LTIVGMLILHGSSTETVVSFFRTIVPHQNVGICITLLPPRCATRGENHFDIYQQWEFRSPTERPTPPAS
jgi:hypothetical protein